jgi:DNA invertase Pin-like site-specific DNA recombinase
MTSINNPFSEGNRVCGYTRDSGGKDQDLSIFQQRESIGKWCSEKGLILSRVFEDIARSGASTTARDQFLAMIDYLSGQVPEKGIVLWEFARLSRDYDDLMYYVSDLKRQGYIVHSINDSVPEGLEGSLMLGVKAYANAKFLLDLRRNVRRGMHYMVRTHHAHTTKAPFGYMVKKESIGTRRDGSPHIISRLIPNPDTVPLVQHAFEMRSHGATTREIDAAFHIYPWLTNYGQMFNNEIYTGKYNYGGEVIDGYCDPIISNELWQSTRIVQEARSKRSGVNHPRAIHSRFWLTGILFCSRCGMAMTGRSANPTGYRQYDYYRCQSNATVTPCDNGYIPKRDIESRIMDGIRSIILDKSVLDEVIEKEHAQQSSRESKHDILCQRNIQELRVTEQEISRLLAAIKDIGHSRALLAELTLLEAKSLELNQQIAQIELQTTISVFTLSLDDIIDNIQSALDISNEQQRAIILRGFINRIEAQCARKVITGRILFQTPKMGKIFLPL